MTIADHVLSFYEKPPFSFPNKDLVEVHNPFEDEKRREAIIEYYRKFFDDNVPRVHVLGINPSRILDTATGIHYTDGFALEEHCGIPNDFSKSRELTSKFFYMIVNAMGEAGQFFDRVFPWALMPFSLTKGGIYKNHYDIDVSEHVQEILTANLEWLTKSVPAAGRLVVLGLGDNKRTIQKLEGFPFGYSDLRCLPHPRWVMQYNSANIEKYIAQYVDALS